MRFAHRSCAVCLEPRSLEVRHSVDVSVGRLQSKLQRLGVVFEERFLRSGF